MGLVGAVVCRRVSGLRQGWISDEQLE